MHRRLVGGLLLVVVLTLAVVIPNLGGVHQEGIGTPIQLPEDPRVGDCLLQPLTDFIAISPSGSDPPLAPTFAPCDGRNVEGQVVAVVRATGSVTARLRQAEDSGGGCYQSSLKYSGLVLHDGRTVLADQSLDDPVDWNLTINVRSGWVLPAPLLQTAGQTWVACIAAPLSGATYRGQLADAFSGGKLPDEFGFCWEQDLPSNFGSVSCSNPHHAELVSLGTIPDGRTVASADIESSCQTLAAKVIGRSDPTAAGRLKVATS